jgi:protein-S-isoprenylcysteine O-methyltransferase Ste14
VISSHFVLLVIFAFFVSLIFAVLTRDSPREQVRVGGIIFGSFLAAAIVLGWLMYPFPR